MHNYARKVHSTHAAPLVRVNDSCQASKRISSSILSGACALFALSVLYAFIEQGPFAALASVLMRSAAAADAPKAKAAGKVDTASDNSEAARVFLQQREAASGGRWVVHLLPVLKRGDLDDWDDFKVGYAAVLKDTNAFHMWYRGCHLLGMTYACGIGHASSPDGVVWSKTRDPVFMPGNAVEQRRLHSLTVLLAGDYYWMWYSVDGDPYAGRPYATIHLATSRDGLHWTPRGAVLRALSGWTPSLEPSAHFDGKVFHLWYIDYPNDDDRTLIHVTSPDGAKWQQIGATALGPLNVRAGRLAVTWDGASYRALFSSNSRAASEHAIDLLTSSDGSRWERSRLPSSLARHDVDPAGGIAVAPAILRVNDGTMVWLTLRPASGAEDIRLAFLKGG